MTHDEAIELLAANAGDEEPLFLPPGVLYTIGIAEVPEDMLIRVGVLKGRYIDVDWEGALRKTNGVLLGDAEYAWPRKVWSASIGLEQYLDLIRRAVEVRARTHGDVTVPDFEDDGNNIRLSFTVSTSETTVGDAYNKIRSICTQLEETADKALLEIETRIAEVAARLSGWGSESLDALVVAVETAKTTDEKGRSLEELLSRLVETVTGFSVTGRIKTATEEIDISILNNSDDPRFKRESALILGECKNWSSKCGKNEFVIFKEKLENRNRRCSMGFLVSWNGFAETVTKEMLRGSKEEFLIVPIIGKDIRAAVRDKNFPDVLVACWTAAVNL